MNAYPDCYTSTADHLSDLHLTDDQLDDQLIGDLAPTPAAHLAACSLCAGRVAAALSPIDSFHTVSAAWSERRSATLPIPVPTQPRPSWQRNSAWATACLALAFGFALTNASHQLALQTAALPSASEQPASIQSAPIQDASMQPAAMQPALAPSRAAQISADNHLLRSIDAAFNPSSDSPAALGLVSEIAPNTGPPTSLQNLPVQD